MISANEAANLTQTAANEARRELEEKLQIVITSACAQGSEKATFYPKNEYHAENAIHVLQINGFSAELIYAKDQRDKDRIEINWSERK